MEKTNAKVIANHQSEQEQTVRGTNQNSQQLVVTCSMRGRNRACKLPLDLV